MGHIYAKTLFAVDLKFTFKWNPEFLFTKSGNPRAHSSLSSQSGTVTDRGAEEQTLKQHSCAGSSPGELWGWTLVWEKFGCDAVTTKAPLTPRGALESGCPIEWS